MFRFILLFSIINFFSCLDNRHAPVLTNIRKDTSLKIITTGLASLETITQLDSLAKKYGFKYYPIGCVVPKQTMDSIEKENKLTYTLLEERYGENWRKNFNSEYYLTNQIRQQADSLINTKFLQKDKYFYYLVLPTKQKDSFQVKVYSTDSLNGKPELIVHYKIAIVLGQFSKVLISETFEKF